MLVHTAVPLKLSEESVNQKLEVNEMATSPSKTTPDFELKIEKSSPKPDSGAPRILNKQANTSTSFKFTPKTSFFVTKNSVKVPNEQEVSSNEVNSSFNDELIQFCESTETEESNTIFLGNDEYVIETESEAPPPPAKKAKIVQRKLQEITKIEPEIEEKIADEKITEFIFMGQLYVQMPKNQYLNEKKKYEEKISYYKNILGKLSSSIQEALKT